MDNQTFEDPERWESLAVEDQCTLSSLSPLESQPWILSRIVQYEKYIRALKSAYNRHSLINRRLPPEVLMEIFWRVRPTSFHELKVMHVCQMWRRLTMGTPEFWVDVLEIPEVTSSLRQTTCFNVLRVQERFKIILARSAPYPIQLPPVTLTDYMVQTLSPHLCRITSLEVTGSSQHMLCEMLSRGMPMLESLLVRQPLLPIMGGSGQTITPFHFPHDDVLPRLRVLTLPLELMNATGNLPAKSLQSFSISFSRESTVVPLRGLFEFLRGCPSLQQFIVLDRVPIDLSTAIVSFHSFPQVHLPHLLLLDFVFNEADAISVLLRPLILPPTVTLKMTALIKHNNLDAAIPTALIAHPVLLATTHVVLAFTDRHTPVEVTCAVGPKALRLSLKMIDKLLGLSRNNRVITELAALLSSLPNITDLHVKADNPKCYAQLGILARMEELLHSMPNLVQLTVRLRGELPNDIFNALGGWSERGDLPCPALRRLSVGWTIPHRTSYELFDRTCKQIRTVLAGRATELGRPLERFEFVCLKYKRLEPATRQLKPLKETTRLIKQFGACADRVRGMVYEDQ